MHEGGGGQWNGESGVEKITISELKYLKKSKKYFGGMGGKQKAFL